MAIAVERPYRSHGARGAAHHARDPDWHRPPQHTRGARTTHAVRHSAGRRRRHVWRDLAVALLVVALAAVVVVGLLHADPDLRAAVVDLLRDVEVGARERVAALVQR